MPPMGTMDPLENTGTTCLRLPQLLLHPPLTTQPLPRLLLIIQLPKLCIMPTTLLTMKTTPTTLPHIMPIPLPQLPHISVTLLQMPKIPTIQTTHPQLQTQAKTHQLT